MVAKKKKKPIKTRTTRKALICPKCGSRNIDYASLHPESGEIVGLGIPEKYYCSDCGYTGSIIIELDEKNLKTTKVKLLKKEWKTRRRRASHVEILKPVFAVVILFFLLTTFAMVIPKYKIEKAQPQTNFFEIGSIKGLEQTNKETITSKTTPILVVSVQNSSISQVAEAIGFPSIASFLFPLFLIFFTAGLFILMIYSHGQRLKMFS